MGTANTTLWDPRVSSRVHPFARGRQWQEFLDVGAFDDADPAYRRPVEFDEFEEEAFWDTDFLFLYSDRHDGIDKSEAGKHLGMAPQDFDSWFTLARGDYQIHPYHVGW
jgi:hypothetical protein